MEGICFLTSFLPCNIRASLNQFHRTLAQVSHSTGRERARVDATSLFPGRIVQHRHQETPGGFSSSGAVSLHLLIADAFGSGVAGREASSAMKSLVWVTGGNLHLCLSACWHLNTFPRAGEAVGAQGRSAQPDESLPGLFLLLQPIPPAKSCCPVCRDVINHFGDCFNPPPPAWAQGLG